jgi:hypothetical protein
MRKSLRYLRIAFSTTCLIACVLLIALCARSYHFDDMVDGPVKGGKAAFIQSRVGRIMFGMGPRYHDDPWQWRRSEKFKHVDQVMEATYKDEFLGFQVTIGTRVFFHLPYWFCILLFASFGAIGVLPWLSWRFSLRTLLIATTLVAVVLGMIVWLSG